MDLKKYMVLSSPGILIAFKLWLWIMGAPFSYDTEHVVGSIIFVVINLIAAGFLTALSDGKSEKSRW